MKKRSFILHFLIIFLGALSMVSCGGGGSSGSASSDDGGATIPSSFVRSSYDNASDSTKDYAVSLDGLVNNRVLISFTNTNSGELALPSGSGAGVYSVDLSFDFSPNTTSQKNNIPEYVKEFNEHPPSFERMSLDQMRNVFPSLPVYDDVVGVTTRDWKTSSTAASSYDPVSTTLRAQESLSGGKLLKVWIANDMWDAVGGVNKKIDQSKLNLIVEKFATVTNIYSKVRGLVGLEWGAHGYGNLIPSDTNDINIVYADLGDPGSWGLLGFFWSVNNFKSTSYAYSNEALAFFMDAPTFGEDSDNDGLWEGTEDAGPVKMLGTLAHEFQHMIHFYQKNVLRGVNTATWFNELASMTVEDILSENIGGTGTGPSQGNSSRLARYVGTPICNVTLWAEVGECDTYDRYATSYSFGGYLLRHYGGTSFLGHMIQSNTTSLEDGVAYALSQEGAGITWREALKRWGASLAMNQSRGTLGSGYGYPKLVDGDYTLQQADIYSFSTAPRIYTSLPSSIRGYSSVVLDKGAQTGSYSFILTLPPGVMATIMVEP